MKWFKLYGQDWLTDTKLLSLSGNERSCLITLFSYGSINEDGVIKNLSEEQLMFQSGISPMGDEWDCTMGVLEKLKKLKIISIDNDVITILNWKKRQETNLTSYERVKRHRAKKQLDNEMITLEEKRIEKNRIDKDIITTKVVRAKAQPREDINILLDGIREIVGVIDGSQKEQRNFAKNFIDSKTPEILRRAGNLNPDKQQIIKATLRIFELATQDNFHRKNCNSIKYVYNKAAGIALSGQNNKPKVAIIS